MYRPTLLVAALFVLQTAGAAPAAWETVVSEDGTFSVEMPATPNARSNGTSTGKNGRVQVVGKGYRSGAQGYFVQRADYPANIVLGSDDSLLDEQRDDILRRYRTKPTSETKIRLEGAGGAPGREFTFRGTPRGETGTVTVKVREYLVGRSVYALIVSSPVDGKLPDDAERFLGSLKLLATAAQPAAGAAAPAPARRRPAAASGSGAVDGLIVGWGTAVDPVGDCNLHRDGANLVMDLPAKPHDLTPFSRLFNVPRVVRPVEGDFEVQVKVEGDFKPSGTSERLVDEPQNGAGLIVLGEGQAHIILDKMVFMRQGRLISSVELAQRGAGGNRGNRNPQLGQSTRYLRLARKGKQVLASASPDGKEWTALKPLESQLPDRVQVGVVAINTSKEPFSVTFSELKLDGR
jgi:regulation of enolase protein 1 (concanavalin A-like superfamily)